jgi:predicted DNA-binding transcriptional regulator AlpA
MRSSGVLSLVCGNSAGKHLRTRCFAPSPRFREFSRKPVLRPFFPRFSPLCTSLRCWKLPAPQLNRGTKVNSISISDAGVSTPPRTKVTLSPWVNEPLPPFQELLSAHDVARLTRRPKLVIAGLMFLRRFPKKRRYRGRQIGWLRADVLDWMTRGLAIDDAGEKTDLAPRRCAKATPRQPCLPLECMSPCSQEPRRATYSTSAPARHKKRTGVRGL